MAAAVGRCRIIRSCQSVYHRRRASGRRPVPFRSEGRLRSPGANEVRRMAFAERQSEGELATNESHGQRAAVGLTNHSVEDGGDALRGKLAAVVCRSGGYRAEGAGGPREGAPLGPLRGGFEVLSRRNEIAAPSLLCADLREPEGGYRCRGHRLRWLWRHLFY